MHNLYATYAHSVRSRARKHAIITQQSTKHVIHLIKKSTHHKKPNKTDVHTYIDQGWFVSSSPETNETLDTTETAVVQVRRQSRRCESDHLIARRKLLPQGGKYYADIRDGGLHIQINLLEDELVYF